MSTPPIPYQRHPWAVWFSKSEFTLVRGVDYGCQTHGMVQALRNAANDDRWRLRLSISVDGDRIEVKVLGPSEPKRKRKPCPRPAKFPKVK